MLDSLYPSPEEYSQLLRSFDFKVTYIELIPRLAKLPGDILGWLEVFAQPFIEAIPSSDRERYVMDVRDELKETLQDSAGDWFANYED